MQADQLHLYRAEMLGEMQQDADSPNGPEHIFVDGISFSEQLEDLKLDIHFNCGFLRQCRYLLSILASKILAEDLTNLQRDEAAEQEKRYGQELEPHERSFHTVFRLLGDDSGQLKQSVADFCEFFRGAHQCLDSSPNVVLLRNLEGERRKTMFDFRSLLREQPAQVFEFLRLVVESWDANLPVIQEDQSD